MHVNLLGGAAAVCLHTDLLLLQTKPIPCLWLHGVPTHP